VVFVNYGICWRLALALTVMGDDGEDGAGDDGLFDGDDDKPKMMMMMMMMMIKLA
jgi:hypothetical protein